MTHSSRLNINTDNAEIIIKKLVNHWRHKMKITQANNISTIPFSETAHATLEHQTNQLIATLHTEQQEDLEKLQYVVLDHLNRMAKQEFANTWQPLT